MFIKRLCMFMLLMFVLAACGGGDTEVATEIPAATERPEPTARPTATVAAVEPTVVPVAQGEIPAPPQSSPYVKGEDEVVDAAVEGMESSFATQDMSGFSLTTPKFYTSDASVAELTAFYDDEMPNYGWGMGQTQDAEFGQVLLYLGPDMNTAGLIGILDMATVDPTLEGKVIFTTVGTGEEMTGELDSPTPGPVNTSDMYIPSTPGSLTYVEGSDPIVDAAVNGMKESFATQEDLDMTPIEFYVTDEDLDTVTDFYAEEMSYYGWDTTGGQTQDQSFGRVIVYPAVDDENTIAMVGVLDMSTVDASLSGLIIFTTIGTPPGSGGSTGGSTGAQMSPEIADIPLPDDATEVVKGDDEILDLLITSLEDSMQSTLDDESMSINGQYLFRTSMDTAELVESYRKEMTSRGWKSEADDETEGVSVLVYTQDDTQGVVIMVMDGAQFMQDQNLLLMMDVSKK